jgi:hypothetical protein
LLSSSEFTVENPSTIKKWWLCLRVAPCSRILEAEKEFSLSAVDFEIDVYFYRVGLSSLIMFSYFFRILTPLRSANLT